MPSMDYGIPTPGNQLEVLKAIGYGQFLLFFLREEDATEDGELDDAWSEPATRTGGEAWKELDTDCSRPKMGCKKTADNDITEVESATKEEKEEYDRATVQHKKAGKDFKKRNNCINKGAKKITGTVHIQLLLILPIGSQELESHNPYSA